MEVTKLFKNIEVLGDMPKNININGISIDNRSVKAGDAFVCISGTQVDGHNYAESAVRQGARLLVTERALPLDIPQIVVNNSRVALSKMAANFYDNPREKFKLIGITGTNGKTTTTYMIKNILECAGHNVGLIGTIGVMIKDKHYPATLTTPDPLELQRTFRQMADRGVDTVVMEVSAHAIALDKLAGVHFDVGVLTNITQDHLDFFGTFKNYANTKMRFIKPNFCSVGIVNADDPRGMDLVIAMQNCKRDDFSVRSFGISSPADNFATNIKYDINGTHYFLNINDELACINTRLIGEFNVYNALAAASACSLIGVDMEAIKLGINSMDFVPGRFNMIKLPNGAGVVIDYAHTPDGLENILSSVKQITRGKVISVFGCGGNRDKKKRAIMGEISERYADFTVLTSDNPRLENPDEIIRDIDKGIKNKDSVISITDRAEAISYAISKLASGDVAVLAGKGAEDYLDIGGKKIHYSDFETVDNIVRNMREAERC